MSHAAVVAQPRVLADVLPHARARDAALVLGAALFTALCAQISFPVPGSPVPVSGQTFAVMLCGAGLGANRGAGAMALYGAMGTAGLPFFSEGESGIDVIWGATGGYIVGFVLAAYVVGRLAERRMDRDPWKALPLFTVGQLIIFAIGVPWLAVVVDATPAEAISMGFTPFILGGIVKAVAAAALLPTAWKLAGRR